MNNFKTIDVEQTKVLFAPNDPTIPSTYVLLHTKSASNGQVHKYTDLNGNILNISTYLGGGVIREDVDSKYSAVDYFNDGVYVFTVYRLDSHNLWRVNRRELSTGDLSVADNLTTQPTQAELNDGTLTYI